MPAIDRLLDGIERLNRAIGRVAAWLLLPVVVIVFAVVVLRYGFGWGRIWLQESYVWLHSTAFLLGAAWTLSRDGHVRIDILYSRAGPRARAAIDLVGSLLLLAPWMVTILLMTWPYVGQSWGLREASREAGGLPALYLLKSMILLFATLVLLQGIVLAGRCLLVLAGYRRSAFSPAHERSGLADPPLEHL
jgi:TRAP-type mannitol/chloroaromatic compound transport system permease small subunit